MASVFFARLVGPSGFARTVAVKRPHAHLVSDRAFITMLIDEARLASRVRHPNVVATLDVVETPSALALVMEYVHGESLARLWSAARTRGERIPLPIAAQIMIDALHGLHAAHEAVDEQGQPLGIVHRDISPQNLIVGADGITRIADFGIAKAAGRLQTTRDGALKGKYAYMAPEQIRGKAVTRQTDVFAASIVLWEVLTGQSLFRASTEAEEIYNALEAVVDAPSARDPKVPPAFDAIVLRGLARDPAQRYATARDMAAALERAAPAIRAPEIGAWVAALAGDVLTARAAVIADMERLALGSETSGPGLPLVTNVHTDPLRPSQGAYTGAHSQVSHAGVVGEPIASTTTAPSPGSSRWFTLAAFAGLLALGAYAAFSFNVRSEPHGAADSARPPVANAPSVPSPALTAIPAASNAPVAPLESAEPRSSAAPAAASAPTVAAAPAAASAVVKPDRRSTPKKSQSSSCDPPYIIDAQGREVFKLQCL
jgi:serine/threonine-protein kinase